MADAIAKSVQSNLVNNWGRMAYMFDFLTPGVGVVNGKGDSVDIPTQAAPTNRSATTRAAAQALAPTVDTMIADQELFYNVALPKKSVLQLLNGGWVEASTPAMLSHMANERDDNVIAHVISTILSGQNTDNQVNQSSPDSLTLDDLANAEAKLADVPGNNRANFMYIMSAYAYGSVQKLGAFIPAQTQAEQGRLGIPRITTINGIPAFLTGGGALRDVTLTTSSAITIASNVATATVPSGHGFSAGMLLKTEGATTDLTAATAITSVTDTTIVYPLTAADGALADGIADFKMASSGLLLFDRTKIFKASQMMPTAEIVSDYESAHKALQVYTCYARQAVGGTASPSAMLIHAPAASV